MKVKLRRSLALLISVLQVLTMYTPIAYAENFDNQVVEQQLLEQQVFEQEDFIQQETLQEPQFTYGPYSGGGDGKKHAYEPFTEDKADSLVVAENAQTGTYATDHVNVKLKDTATNGTMMASVPTFSEYGISNIEPIFKISEGSRSLMSSDSEASDELLKWYTAVLSEDMDPKEAVKILLEDPYVETAELDYYRQIDSTTPTEITDPKMTDQWYLENTKIKEAWAHLESQGINPGGSRDVVVAVIDTGVDSAHPDLISNMWINTGEIPGNNIDDDGNGFIDDINGASTVGDKWAGESGASLDDHGHGTHVAGIIAASANDGGMTGIAYNTQIMAIKAAQSSGVLTSSDIVEAIYYAIDKGADVINMSFGGYGQNQLEEDALAVAFGQAVLVAAAGNDSLPNVPYPFIGKDMFPAAYPWVLGVMAESQYPASNGDYLANFSNWDYMPKDSHEYELMAPGVDILSTLPNEQYAKWDGTSMAAPVVSGIAALLRSKFADPNSYSSRFIMGQLISTGVEKQGITYDLKKPPRYYNSVNAYNALTDTPEPNLSYLEHFIFDSESLDINNNGDGVVDAGEVLDLALVIRNHWGKADNVQVTIDTKGSGGMDDPYVTLINDTVNYGAVGNFGTDDNGLIIENDVVVGVENAFKIKIAENTPNDHLVPINITLTCSNGFDPADTTVYTFNSGFNFLVRRGTVVPNVISENMTLTNDKYWIIPNATLVKAGATLTIEPGTQVQFWSSEPEGPYSEKAMAYLKVEGNLNVNGTAENPVEMFTSGFFEGYEVKIEGFGRKDGDDGIYSEISYAKILNPNISVDKINHCYFTQELTNTLIGRYLSSGTVYNSGIPPKVYSSTSIKNSIFYKLGYKYCKLLVNGILLENLFDSCVLDFNETISEDNVYLRNYKIYENPYGDREYQTSQAHDFSFNLMPEEILECKYPEKNNANGSTYFLVNPNFSFGNTTMSVLENLATQFNGHIVTINDEDENEFLTSYMKKNSITDVYIGLNDMEVDGQFEWINSEDTNYESWADSQPSTNGDNVLLNTNGSWYSYPLSNRPFIIEIPGLIDTKSISLSAQELILGEGGLPYSLSVSFNPINSTNKNLKWSSSNTEVATVDEKGKITPLLIGETIITVTAEDGGFSDNCKVSVIEAIPATGITLNKNETNIYINNSEKVIASIEPYNATDRTIIWETDNSDIANISNDGTINGLSNGTTVIRAKTADGLYIAECIVNVLIPVESVSLKEDFIRLSMKSTPTSIEATIKPFDASNQKINWMSTNTSVVDVDGSGRIIPIGEGVAYIIASTEEGNYSDSCCVAINYETINSFATMIDARYGGTLALDEEGKAWSWGSNGYGQIGDGTFIDRKVPIRVLNEANITQISAGPFHNLAIDSDKNLWAWGNNDYSNLGTGDSNDRNIPVKINNFINVLKASAGYSHSMALKSDGTVWTWGDNEYGQLGIGISGNIIGTPVQVEGLENIIDISAGYKCSYALKEDGTVWAWGSNEYGKLGTGLSSSIPIKIEGLTDIVQISAGQLHCLALKSDGTVWSWGNNSSGQLGNETIDDSNYPIIVNSLSEVVQISAGYQYSMALREDGTVWTWGSNSYKVLGYDTTDGYSYKPNMVDGLSQLIQISAGISHSVVLKNDGTIWTWGTSTLGNMYTDNSIIPVQSIFGLIIDTTSPLINNTIPNANDAGVSVLEGITLIFNEGILSSDNFNLITLKDENNNSISLKQKMIKGNEIRIETISSLENDMTYTLNVPSNAVKDYFNNKLSNSFNLTFTTEGANQVQTLEIPLSRLTQEVNEYGQYILTQEEIDQKRLEFIQNGHISTLKNNAFLNIWNDSDPSHWMRFTGSEISDYKRYISNNYWGTSSDFLISKAIIDFNDFMNLQEVVYKPFLTEAPESCYPFVTDVYVTNSSGDIVSEVGAEPIQIHVLFNRDMDQTVQPQVNFGPDLPTTDYTVNAVDGGWATPRHWVGEMTITPLTGDGYQFFRVAGAVAADDPWLVTGNDSERFGFEIITSGTEAMNLQATGGENKVELSWTQNDYDLLAGYNLYRSETINGTYSKINSTLIPYEQKYYTDTNVTPGKQYFYKFTVVKTDLSESDFSNIASATPNDTIAPVITHTPVQAAAPGLPLQIYADVTDNVRVVSATLYYRTSNKDNPAEYKTLPMIKTTGNRYSATIEGSSVAAPGLEYYIEAFDGSTLKRCGRADLPYFVQITDAPKITSISPASGPASGGTNVVITGSNFKEGATVTFGDAVASNVAVESSTRITATAPVHIPAEVDVKVTNIDGYSSLLLLGFNYQSEGVDVSIPDIEANVGQIIEVPINIANVNGLLSTQMKITFNPALLSYNGVRNGNLTSGFMFSGNSNNPGEVTFSSISATPTSGTGTLAVIELEVLNSEINTSDIVFDIVSINDGSIKVNVFNGTFNLMDLYEISGNVNYYNVGYPVNNASLKLEGTRTYNTISSGYGAYKISGIERGDYKLSASKSDEANGISSYDASLILQYITGKISLNSNLLIAADVNRNGTVTAMDAAYILQKAVDLISLPFPGAGEVWLFLPSEKLFVDLTSSKTYENFNGILLGDISGNWNGGTELLSISNTEIVTGDMVTGNLTNIIPMGIECNGEEIYALDLKVSYDPSKSKFLDAYSTSSTDDYLIYSNEATPGTVKIAIASDQPLSSGKLLELTFSVLAEGDLGVSVENANSNERQVLSLNEDYYSTGLISHFIIEKDGMKIVVPLAGVTGYAYAYSTQNELYKYLKGNNNCPLIAGLLSGTKYMPIDGNDGYAINYSLKETAKEAMQYTPWLCKENYRTYYLFEGFDAGGNAILTLLNQ